jgi:RNA polymerase sigma-70 factor, ECF subfamily
VLQEAYVRAFAGLEGFRGEARFGTWLARIVINESLQCVRRRRPTTEIDLVADSPSLNAQIIPFPTAGHESDPEAALAQSEIRALLERAIDRLPDGFREVLIAKLIEGMSVDEAADAFAILPQTVKTRLFRAWALLRAEIEKEIGPVLGDASVDRKGAGPAGADLIAGNLSAATSSNGGRLCAGKTEGGGNEV